MELDKLTVNVSAKLTVSDETAERCLRILEMWVNDNPGRSIVGNTEGGRTTFELHSFSERHGE